MSVREKQRRVVASRLAEYILEHGLAATSLRQLAKAAGVSDRMLLYYFADKAEVLWESLSQITEGLITVLDAAVPDRRFDLDTLLAKALQLTRSAEVRPSMRLWLEIIAAAAKNEEPFPKLAAEILNRFLDWLDQRLAIPDDAKRSEAAARILATIDGIALFDLVGREDLARSAQRYS
jgi:AcrR family transcriptional regulator